MPFVLIDTCTERGILAYGNSQDILFEKELPFGLNQSKFLLPELTKALQPFGFPLKVEAIGVGVGPGSYTGIRIGVAVAQALAYSWNIPLIGFCSLEGFIPDQPSASYASIIDARIGGVYFLKGQSEAKGIIKDKVQPQVAELQEARELLKEVTHLITPYAQSLKGKLKGDLVEDPWIWEEKAPSAAVLLKIIEQSHLEGKYVISPQQLEILYLRQTEAERNKKSQNKD